MITASLILINYNDKKRICRAIDSCINQTWKDTEVIVVDDGSDKETRELYKQYGDKINLVQLERDDKASRTPSRARNAGYEKSTGDYVAFLDSDNYYATNFISECFKNEADVYFVNWEIIGLQSYVCDIEKVWDFNEQLMSNYLRFQHMDHQCLLTKREMYVILKEQYGHLYDVRLPRSQDCDLIVRLLKSDCEWRHVQERLFFFEKHESDQNKTYASIHGKTLWTLKNDINYAWLMDIIKKDPFLIASFYQAIFDFSNDPQWTVDYDKSAYKKMMIEHAKVLNGERRE